MTDPVPDLDEVTPLDLQPTLAGKIVALRPLEKDDFEALYQAAADPLIWEQHPHRDRYQPEVFKEFFTAAIASRGALLVTDQASGSAIGTSRYYGWDPATREIGIGFTFLARSHWGGPANREMKTLMLNHIFQWAEAVWFHVGVENHRSRRAVEKLGAAYSHTAPFPEGAAPHAFYRLTAHDFQARG
ncbi:GNAT family N-acetyltransferase [Luteolibacter marinus]|uniref:GNAT family N-acetyltransferase n=1 Tax=Luteolibacter marinus TaxID=2776705 RepID=UPI001865FB09|nr:GNAT family N-acetyltransferase [Luteolibacter marinus]